MLAESPALTTDKLEVKAGEESARPRLLQRGAGVTRVCDNAIMLPEDVRQYK